MSRLLVSRGDDAMLLLQKIQETCRFASKGLLLQKSSELVASPTNVTSNKDEEVSLLRREVQTLSQEAVKDAERLIKFQLEVGTLTQANAALRDKSTLMQELVADLENKLQSMSSEQSERESTRATMSTTISELAAAQKAKQSAEKFAVECERQMHEAILAKAAADKELDAGVKAKGAAETRVSRLEVDLQSARRAKEEGDGKIEAQKGMIERLKADLSAVASAKETEAFDRTEMQTELDAARGALAQSEAYTQSLHVRINTALEEAQRGRGFEQQVKSLENELKAAKEEHAAKLLRLEGDLREARDHTEAKEGSLSSELQKARSAHTAAEDHVVKLKTQMRKELTAASEVATQAQEAAARALQEEKEKTHLLGQQVTRLQSSLDASAATQKGEVDKSKALVAELSALRQEIASEKEARGLADEKTSGAKLANEARIAELENELALASGREKKLEKDLRDAVDQAASQIKNATLLHEKKLQEAVDEHTSAQAELKTASETRREKLQFELQQSQAEKEQLAMQVYAQSETIDELKKLLSELSGISQGAPSSSSPSSHASSSSSTPALPSAMPVAAEAAAAAAADLDREFVFGSQQPIVLVEIGSYEARIGMWNNERNMFEIRFVCPAYTATCTSGNRDKYASLVQGASFLSDPMYQYFREQGVFVGSDAQYCLFDHPDAGLRGSLELDAPAVGGSGRIVSSKNFVHILQHLFTKGLGLTDAAQVQLLFAYKLSFLDADMIVLAEALFERLSCCKVCLLSEAALIASSISSSSSSSSAFTGSCLIVDIGSTSLSVHPTYESIIMRNAIRSSAVGGEHCTELLSLLLSAQELESYNSQLPRRRMDVARQVKEACGLVISDWDEGQAKYGAFAFDKIKVIFNAASAAAGGGLVLDAALLGKEGRGEGSKAKVANLQKIKEIQRTVQVFLSEGGTASITVDKERFYCSEVLFQPRLLESCLATQGLVETILASAAAVDASVREEICSLIVVAGRSALLPGLAERLQRSLREGLGALGVRSFGIIIAEEAPSSSSSSASSSSSSRRLSSGGGVAKFAGTAPSASWKGASSKLASAKQSSAASASIENQNFITDKDYGDMGTSVHTLLIG